MFVREQRVEREPAEREQHGGDDEGRAGAGGDHASEAGRCSGSAGASRGGDWIPATVLLMAS